MARLSRSLAGNPGSQYVSLQPIQGLNNGTVPGGLAFALQSGMQGLMAGRREREAREQQQRRNKAIQSLFAPPGQTGLASGGQPQSPQQQQAMAAASAVGMVGPSSRPQQAQGISGPLSAKLQQIAAFDPDLALQIGLPHMFKEPSATFSTVQNPYGRGGVGQMNNQTGQIVGYQGPQEKAGAKAYTDLGQLRQDLDRGFISPEQYDAEVQRLMAPPPEEPALDPNQLINQETGFADDFSKVTATQRDQIQSYRRIEAIYDDPSKSEFGAGQFVVRDEQGNVKATRPLDADGAADLALIFNFMKMLDPGSVVREGEFALAEKTGGLPGWVQSQWQQVTTGGRLSPAMRKRILTQANRQFVSAQKDIRRQMETAQERAGAYAGMGIQPERAIRHSFYEPVFPPEYFASPDVRQAIAADFSDMTDRDIRDFIASRGGESNLSPEELLGINRRLDILEANRGP